MKDNGYGLQLHKFQNLTTSAEHTNFLLKKWQRKNWPSMLQMA